MTDKGIRVSTPFQRDDRGVSEVLAFVLVFGIILSSVTILSMTGFQAMEGYQENEQQRNADRAMIALSDNFNDVLRYDGVNQRYGELAVRGGTVTIDPDAGAQLKIEDESDDSILDDEFSHLDDPLPLGSFTYESGSETIAYEGGALVRESESGSLVLDEPQVRYNEDRDVAIVSLVKLTGDTRSIQSDGSQGFTISVEKRTSKMIYDDDLTIEAVGGERRDTTWNEDILEENDWDNIDDADRILITIVEVEIDY